MVHAIDGDIVTVLRGWAWQELASDIVSGKVTTTIASHERLFVVWKLISRLDFSWIKGLLGNSLNSCIDPGAKEEAFKAKFSASED